MLKKIEINTLKNVNPPLSKPKLKDEVSEVDFIKEATILR